MVSPGLLHSARSDRSCPFSGETFLSYVVQIEASKIPDAQASRSPDRVARICRAKANLLFHQVASKAGYPAVRNVHATAQAIPPIMAQVGLRIASITSAAAMTAPASRRPFWAIIDATSAATTEIESASKNVETFGETLT